MKELESPHDALHAGRDLLGQSGLSGSREHRLHEVGYEDDNTELSDIHPGIRRRKLSSHTVSRLFD